MFQFDQLAVFMVDANWAGQPVTGLKTMFTLPHCWRNNQNPKNQNNQNESFRGPSDTWLFATYIGHFSASYSPEIILIGKKNFKNLFWPEGIFDLKNGIRFRPKIHNYPWHCCLQHCQKCNGMPNLPVGSCKLEIPIEKLSVGACLK